MLTLFKTVVLLLIVVTGKAPLLSASQGAIDLIPGLGWIVLSGKTRVKDPHVNFRHAFAGSSTSAHDVCTPNRPLIRSALIFS